MSLTDQIMELMLREGDINADRQREIIAAEEEKRQAKHRLLKNTLKAIATIGPYFIPGAGIIPALGGKAGPIVGGIGRVASGGNPFDVYRYLQNRPGVSGQPMPWDEEGIG